MEGIPLQRTRTSGSQNTGPGYTFHDTTCVGNVWALRAISATQEPGCAVGEWKVTTDEVTPGFRALSASGQLRFNPYSTKTEKCIVSGSGPTEVSPPSYTCGGVSTRVRTRVNEGAGWVSLVYSLMCGQAVTKGRILPHGAVSQDISRLIGLASTDVRNSRGRGNTNMWENLAEANQTLALLSSMMGRGLREYRWIRSGGLFGKRPLPRRLHNLPTDRPDSRDYANAWLAWKYGMQPLIKDVSELLRQLQTAQPLRVTTRSKIVDEQVSSDTLSYNATYAIYSSSRETRQKVTVRAMSLEEITDGWNGKFGFATKDLVTLPWELVNKSFVLDWFFNVGDFIGAWVPPVGMNSLGSCYTVETDTMTTVTPSGVTPLLGWSTSGWSGLIERSTHSKQRVIGLPYPSVHVKTDFGFTNVERVLTSLSLLRQQVKRAPNRVPII